MNKIIFLPLASAFLISSVFAKTVDITILNYTGQPLTYITEEKSLNSQMDLPSSISAGSLSAASVAHAAVSITQQMTPASGYFRIGYRDGHYCEYAYNLEKVKGGWYWFMDASSTHGMSLPSGNQGVSCSVDPDQHQTIVFRTY